MRATAVEMSKGLFLVLLQVCSAMNATYELQVYVTQLLNFGFGCAETGSMPCCQATLNENCFICNYFLSFCVRDAGEPISYERDEYQGDCLPVNTSPGINNKGREVFTDSVYNLTNPIPFFGMQWPDAGVQLFIELIDNDDPLQLVDRFAINVTTPVGNSMPSDFYFGIFGFAEIELNFTVICTENYFGPNCERLCLENCTCDPGFTGEFCSIDIDDCVGVSCGQNQRCMDGLLSFICECEPGFTGEFCSIDIDDCVGISCGQNQRCVDGLLNFSCECVPGYTGPDCLTDINKCEDINCNNGVCIDGIASFTCTCDPGFTGQLCAVNIDDCVGVFCGQNQTCVDGLQNFTCECLPGLSCQDNSDCIIGSTCIFGSCNANSTKCVCDSGFSGETCDQEESFSSAIILGSTVAAVAVLLIIVGTLLAAMTVIIFKRRSSKARKEKVQITNNLTHSHHLNSRSHEQVEMAHLDPSYCEIASYGVASYTAADSTLIYHYIRNGPGEEGEYDYDSPYWRPAGEENELLRALERLKIQSISVEELKIEQSIGDGVFGTVYKGVWHHRSNRAEDLNVNVSKNVAVKASKEENSQQSRIKFLQEAVIMGQFKHPNIVKILGILVTKLETKIIMEFMSDGSLNDYLPSLMSKCENFGMISQLLHYSRQVASGMSYLSLKGYVHRDLAARNILVSMDDICKISDFGLSRDLNSENIYSSRGMMIPVKWTAPEALHHRKYSLASDVWSYGCVLYEIWSLGATPYETLSAIQTVKKLTTGYRLPPPPGCPRVIYEIMIKCWNNDPESRPEFSDICSTLNYPDYKVLKWSPEDVKRFSEEARTVGAPLKEGESLFQELQHKYSHYVAIID